MEDKHPYIRQEVLSHIEESKKARAANNEGNGLDYGEHKFSGKNFDRLMEQRGKSKEEAQEAKTSFNKWAGEAKDPDMPQEVTAKHSRPEGDIGYVYGTKDGPRSPSGEYVGAEKFDKADEAKSRYAAPAKNQMTEREEVRVHGDQVRGIVAPQPEWTKEAAENGDHVERKGGGTQIYTNGGYKSGAVRSQEGTKVDMKKSDAGESQVDEYGVDLSKAEKPHHTSQEHKRENE